MARLDQTAFEVEILDLIPDGRGVARRADGKAVFVAGALPGERVIARLSAGSRRFDEATTLEVLQPSLNRVQPRCPHFGTCGGCVLQHLAEDQQIVAKQRVLLDNLQRIGHVTPERVLPPLTDASWGYRRKGRLSVRRVEKKNKTLIGFRENDGRYVADLTRCETIIPQIGEKLGELCALVDGMDARREIPQIEFIAGDDTVALVFRHLVPLSERDRAALLAFAQAHDFAIFLQPGGLTSVHALGQQAPELAFRLPQWDVELKFRPLDFIQVNAGLNQKMIARALELLEVQPDECVLELFCGLGNFTLPLARVAHQVVGVEGDAGLVARARDNAAHNALVNAQFHAADLTQDLSGHAWMRAGPLRPFGMAQDKHGSEPAPDLIRGQASAELRAGPGADPLTHFDKLLLDPPRSGADAVLKQLPLKDLKRIVYISCHPGSLARDAGYLVNARGWKLRAAGVMDMFPHTAHVESIAMFEPS